MEATHEAVTPGRETTEDSRARKLYFAAWRWHFYAGLYVIPFLIMLAITGLAMLWINTLDGRDGERITVALTGDPVPVSAQADAAVASVANGTLATYLAPRAADQVSAFAVKTNTDTVFVSVNPYTGDVVDSSSRSDSWYTFFDDLHGSLMMGTIGDRLIEIAASLGVMLIATGLYLWWPRESGWAAVLIPNVTARGRALWKSLHVTIGVWSSVLLFVFLVSGLSWAGVWGEKIVQAWNTFPAEKWDAPLSDDTHASMNHEGAKEVPWPLEQTPMPASGSDAGQAAMASSTHINLDSSSAFARTLGFDARFQLGLLDGEQGVWTISRDSMSSDSVQATADRTVHIDQYTGKVLADVRFENYSIYGQSMAAGIAFHMGTMGLWNLILNTVFCLVTIFLCVSGTVMWWKRRPANAGRLVAPPMPANMPLWQGAVLVGLAVSMAFPMAGLALLIVMTLDYLVLSRLPTFKRVLT